mmetsp:Transcript_31531/g.83792  ORF Transcript_31531/g.83792 Transcript_31531/m.83792 type:complete len:275 (+) Transcript_31531:302-1126(+)
MAPARRRGPTTRNWAALPGMERQGARGVLPQQRATGGAALWGAGAAARGGKRGALHGRRVRQPELFGVRRGLGPEAHAAPGAALGTRHLLRAPGCTWRGTRGGRVRRGLRGRRHLRADAAHLQRQRAAARRLVVAWAALRARRPRRPAPRGHSPAGLPGGPPRRGQRGGPGVPAPARPDALAAGSRQVAAQPRRAAALGRPVGGVVSRGGRHHWSGPRLPARLGPRGLGPAGRGGRVAARAVARRGGEEGRPAVDPRRQGRVAAVRGGRARRRR